MEKQEFETAIRRAISASPNNGAKWKPFEALFASEGLRGGGAISNQHAEQGTRIRQLLTLRPTGGGNKAHSRYCVFVLNRDQNSRYRARPLRAKDSIVENLRLERGPYLPPEDGLESVLILRHENSQLLPVALAKWGDSPMTYQLATWYPDTEIIDLSAELRTTSTDAQATSIAGVSTEDGVLEPGENTIFFGPPGTGKSFRIKEATVGFHDVIHTVFHPEYSYSDFIGSYKPVCGHDASVQVTAFDGVSSISKPIVYYDFDPGILIRAIVRAHEAEGAPVALVIDELNRGDCAAVFGDFLQLLDRADSGRSEYGIDVGVPLGAYLVTAGVSEAVSDKVHLPANLHILATLNTSDQALFLMDSAFKRRWSWQAVPVARHPELEGTNVPATEGSLESSWLDFITTLNNIILRHTENEDKRIGPWYIRARQNVIPIEEIRNKLLYYLWHDVFKGYATEVFHTELRTFEDVQMAFDKGGMPAVLVGFCTVEDNDSLTGETTSDDERVAPSD